MKLQNLFEQLADAFDGATAIEEAAQKALRQAAPTAEYDGPSVPLPAPILDILLAPDALPVCREIARMPFEWVPPKTSEDPLYLAHSTPKVHTELIGPDGVVRSDDVRLGVYGMLAGHEYGLRTHLAEEVFLMLAGEAYWKRGDAEYQPLGPGGRSYHTSMLPHANKTVGRAFMSAYVWIGDISNDSYDYRGHTGDGA